jgi:methyl-accepting chemotaxis protein
MRLMRLCSATGQPIAIGEIQLDRTAWVAAATREKFWIRALTLAVLAGAMLLAWLIGRGIAGPIGRITEAIGALAEGRLDTQIPARANRDEIGAMAKAVQVFKDNAITVQRLEEEAKTNALQAGAERRAARKKLADDFQAAIGGVVNGVSSAATEMPGSAQSLSGTADQASQKASAVSAATEEASAKVAEMQSATGHSVGAIRGIGETISELAGIAAGIAAAVEAQGAATQEIARNVQQAARGTQEVSNNIAGVTEASSETRAASGQMLGAAGELSVQAETLRREVDTFLAQVRAA